MGATNPNYNGIEKFWKKSNHEGKNLLNVKVNPYEIKKS